MIIRNDSFRLKKMHLKRAEKIRKELAAYYGVSVKAYLKALLT
jgi:hypothetical protein